MRLTLKHITAVLIGLGFLFLLIEHAPATQIYFNNFQNEDPVGSEWSSKRTDTVPNPDLVSWGTFLGQFGGEDTVTLSLSGLSNRFITLSFDAYFIRSWDGNATTYGPDRFSVSTGTGLTLLDATFSNGNPAGQSYVGNGMEAPAYAGSGNTSMTGSEQQFSLGYWFYDGIQGTNEAMDSVYHFGFSFFNTSDSVQFIFAGIGLQDNTVTTPTGETYLDESWGLDNVGVDVTPVPEPSSLLLLVIGSFGIAIIARKKTFSE